MNYGISTAMSTIGGDQPQWTRDQRPGTSVHSVQWVAGVQSDIGHWSHCWHATDSSQLLELVIQSSVWSVQKCEGTIFLILLKCFQKLLKNMNDT